MKNILFLITTFTSIFLTAQIQIENGGFEVWENTGSAQEEPTEWSSLKTADDNSILNLANQAPQVIWREINPHSGNYCLYQKVAPYNSLVGLAPNSIATNGRIFSSINANNAYAFTDANTPEWQTICTDRPDSIVGWYKYSPQNNDKGAIDVLFHSNGAQGELPDNGNTSHHIGIGLIEFTQSVSTWTRFSFPIQYSSANAPNFVLIVSSAGDKLNAQEGSELWLDDLSFIYNPEPNSVGEINDQFSFINTNTNLQVTIIDSIEKAEMNIYGLDGKIILTKPLFGGKTIIEKNFSAGIYLYSISIGDQTTTGKFVNL